MRQPYFNTPRADMGRELLALEGRICFEYSYCEKVPISDPPQDAKPVLTCGGRTPRLLPIWASVNRARTVPHICRSQQIWAGTTTPPTKKLSIGHQRNTQRQCTGIATQLALRGTISSFEIKNCAEQVSEPQITGTRPAICLRVISPSTPQHGHASTAQNGSALSPSSPAFSRMKIVPGSICSGIHSFRILISATMFTPVSAIEDSAKIRFLSPFAAGVTGFTLRIHATAVVCRLPNAFPHDLLLEAARPRFPSTATHGFPPVFLPEFAARCHSGIWLRLADENS